MPRRQNDSALFVQFSRRGILNEAKSFGLTILDNNNNVHEVIEGAGRPILDNIDYIHIEIPGDRENIVERPVTCCDPKVLTGETKPSLGCRARKGLDDKPILEECDVHRFFDEYTAFKAGQADQQIGTDLKGWSGIDPASCEELAFYKVYTVEQLAEMNDSLVGRYLALRTRARDFLESSKKSAADMNARSNRAAVEKALENERAERKKLELQINELSAQLAAQKGGDEPKSQKGAAK